MRAWYAIRTRSNFETVTARGLEGKDYEVFLPTYRACKKRRGRNISVRCPLFSGYLFCRFDYEEQLPVLKTPGVVHVVGCGRLPLAVPDHEVESIRRMTECGREVRPCDFISAGDLVRITGGALAGLEGVLLPYNRDNPSARVAVSINLLQRSVSAEVDAFSLELVRRGARRDVPLTARSA